MKPHQKMIAAFTAVALLLHGVLPFFALYQLPVTHDVRSIASLFGERLLICTSDGFKWVRTEDIFKDGQHPKPHPQYQCALCYVSAHGQWLHPSMMAGYVAPQHLHILLTALYMHHDVMLRDAEWRSLLTHAPPSSFVA
jgi:hypothetical protein